MTSVMRSVAISWLLVAVCTSGLQAQQTQPKPPGKPEAKANEAKAQFDQLFKQFKDLLGEIRKLQLEYKKVKPAQRPPIEQAFQEKTAQARKMLADLKRLAEEAYRADSSQEELARFLAVAAFQAHRRGDLEEAIRLFELLESKGFRHPEIDPLAGEAAFSLGRYDLAEKFLTRAKNAGKLPAQLEQMLAQLPREKELWAQEQKLRQEEAKRGDDDPQALPRVLLRTTKGDIVIELFEDQAPNTVANFIHLVEKGFYDGLTFHRVIPGFVAQGGDPKGDGTGGPGYRIPDEHKRKDARRHYWGSVAMARTNEPDSAGSQFYIAFKRLPAMDGSYTVFGRVIQGMDVAVRLNPQNPQEKQNPLPPDRILSARVIRKRSHPYVPKVIRPGSTEPAPLQGAAGSGNDGAPAEKNQGKEGKKEKETSPREKSSPAKQPASKSSPSGAPGPKPDSPAAKPPAKSASPPSESKPSGDPAAENKPK